MDASKPFVVACIPAYNEERSIGGVVVRTKEYVDEVIVCDDGSRDLTGRIAEEMGVDVISHERNMGYGAYNNINIFVPTICVGLDNV